MIGLKGDGGDRGFTGLKGMNKNLNSDFYLIILLVSIRIYSNKHFNWYR